MAERLCYVYGAVRAEGLAGEAPPGVDGAAVHLEPAGPLAALVSSVSADTYEPALVEERSGDVEWIAPRAEAHDRVVTWASDRAPVVPFPLLTLFSSETAVREMLRARQAEIEAALARAAAGREYIVRVYRIEEELRPRLPELSPALAELERSAAVATPGQRYLLERKLGATSREEIRRISAEVARETFDMLSAASEGAAGMGLPPQRDDAPHPAVLNAAFLVSDPGLDEFRSLLTGQITRHSPGFRFEFTGPWPAYHFAGGALDAG